MTAPKSQIEPARARGEKARSARWGLGFWSLIVTQFQGAFNDNALKFLVIYIIVDMGLPGPKRDWLVLVVGALFALPFILFSMTGGYLADRFSKRSVTIGTKWMEVGAMLFALVALGRGNLPMEAAGVFLLSSQGALFGPSKYGLLPELLPEKDLSWGNGVIELGTFLAAITATVASGYLAFYFRGHQHWSGVLLLGCTAIGLVTSFGVTRVPAANPTRKFNINPLGDLWEQMRASGKDRVLTWALVGNTYLWFLAALLQFTIVIYGHDILRIDERHISYLQAAVAVGIGFGSLVTGYLSDGKIEYGLIPLGAAGMTIFGFLSASHGLSLERAAAYLGLLGFFGGFYAVPLNALIQHRPDPARKGGVIAAANLFSFVGVFLAAGVYYLLAEGLHLRADKVFFAGACMTVAATLYAVLLLPDSMRRLGLWILTHTLYRVHIEGRDNIPERGGALFLARELTFLGALWLAASVDRPIHFSISGGPDGSNSILRHLVQLNRPSGSDSVGRTDSLLEPIEKALRANEIACVAGQRFLSKLQEGAGEQTRVQEVLPSTSAPVVTVQVDRANLGALFIQANKLFWRWPRQLPVRVVVRFGSPIEPSARSSSLREALAGPSSTRKTPA